MLSFADVRIAEYDTFEGLEMIDANGSRNIRTTFVQIDVGLDRF